MTRLLVVSDPKILRGKPVMAGTRIAVETIMGLLASGLDVEDILREYPHLTREQILSAIAFAKNLVGQEEIYPLTEKNGQVVFATA